MNYKKKKLLEVCSITMGQSPSSTTYNEQGIGLPFFQGKADFGRVYPGIRQYCSRPIKIAVTNSVLLSVRAPVGAVNIVNMKCCIGRGLAAIADIKNISHFRYIYYYMKSIEKQLILRGVGSTFSAISKSDVESIEIPLPPLETQKKIADVLDMAQELIDKRKQQIELLDKFLQSVFIEMFGDPARNDKGWDVKPIRAISKKLNDGPFGSNLKTEHYQRNGIRVIRLQNIGVGKFLDDDKVYITKGHYLTLEKYKCNEGDVLVGTLGTPNLRACLLPKHIGTCINKADCVRCTPNTEVVTPQYLCCLLNLPSTNKRASTLFHGQTRSRISLGQIAGLEISLPPLDLQNKFAEIVEATEKQRELMERSLALMEMNLKGLMQRAFKGELFN